jgi:RNA polymerase sigma-70 factor (ECF subfamily)
MDFLIVWPGAPPLTAKVVSFHDLSPKFEGNVVSVARSGSAVSSVMSSDPSPEVPDFRAIYDAHFDFVWRSLRRLGVREPDVLDLAQKVFLTAHFKLADFEGRSLVSTWLFGICQRVASDYRRSALIRREVSTENSELDSVATWHEDLSDKSDARHRARAAEAILNKLPEPQRVVFVLFELEEMSGQDIATLLGVSVGTVRSRLRLARDTFRREVKRLSAIDAGGRKEAV